MMPLRTRRSFLALTVITLALPTLGIAAAKEKTVSEYQLTVTPDKPEAVYQKGEPVTFQLRLTQKGQPLDGVELNWTTTKDGVAPKQEGKIKLAAGVGRVTGTLHEPGFLRCEVTYTPPQGAKVVAQGGAALSPCDIGPSAPVPDDFDAFWTEQKRRLAAVPMTPRLTPVKVDGGKCLAYDLQLEALGAPVSGYYARPVKAEARSLPAILTVHGAGVRSSGLGTATSWAGRDFLALDINAHGLPNGRPAKFYDDLANTTLKDYRARGRESRDTVFFREMFLRLVRAIDFLTAQPEWDGQVVIVQGSSQGGYQAIAAAALDPRVTFFSAGVPAGCDHTGFQVGRINGWPKFVATGENPPPEVVTAIRYYDAVNFATRIRVPGFFTVGFIDSTCPPTTVYAAYNALRAPKSIHHDIAAGHTNTPAATAASRAAILRHVEEKRAAKR